MSIALNSIDCPCLTNDCLNNLSEEYAVRTTNDFVLWLRNFSNTNRSFSSNTIECIRACIIAHTANITHREISNTKSYHVKFSLFDNENLLQNKRHLIFIYEDFNQKQWNDYFNILLLRFFLGNESMKMKYLNTNISLFDMKYFYSNYCILNEKIKIQRDEILEKSFYFNHCFTLESFENELTLIENHSEEIKILIIDDFFSLIKPYLNLDRRIKGKFLQLTYRLNRLAQKQSILILNGMISNSRKRIPTCQAFHADQYVRFQASTTMEKEICIEILNETKKTKFKLDLDDWRRI